jgi:hypothetical protein
LERCDAIGKPFHNERIGQYRKLAIWAGEFDEFVYIDCDTVILHPVDFVFNLLQHYDVITSHSHIPAIRRYVWHDSIYDSGVLTTEQIGFSANTGFLASKRGVLDLEKVYAEIDKPLSVAEHMELDCYEQAVLNYLIVTSGHSYTSLFDIKMRTRNREIPLEQWAGREIGKVAGGRIVWPRHPKTLMVHWAGEWERARLTGRQIPHFGLWQFYRSLHDSASKNAASTRTSASTE